MLNYKGHKIDDSRQDKYRTKVLLDKEFDCDNDSIGTVSEITKILSSCSPDDSIHVDIYDKEVSENGAKLEQQRIALYRQIKSIETEEERDARVKSEKSKIDMKMYIEKINIEKAKELLKKHGYTIK